MTSRPFASLLKSAAFLGVPALLAAACSGNVVVEDPDTTTASGCDAGEISCGGACVDPSSDPENCGGCGAVCSGGVCDGGQCIVDPGCPPGLVECSAGCVDVATDPQNCGLCDNVCEAGAQCFGGLCQIAECFCGNVCNVISLVSQVPQVVSGPTSTFGFQVEPVCGDAGGGDITFSFFAESDAFYTFDTFGSSFDSVIQIMDSACSVLDCNNDIGNSTSSSVTVALFGGQQVLVVVASAGGGGNFKLNITTEKPLDCASCNDLVTGATTDLPPCPGKTEALAGAITDCMCSGACIDACIEACTMNELLQSCGNCISDPVNGCGEQLKQCTNDI